ncbi:DUF2863 family protein [Orrella sp. 11846]|uniref:DUF2863 family protein n=1 Tax=Orrella sp. 11846 TaxID=3409913 RepID=UPI003B58CC20
MSKSKRTTKNLSVSAVQKQLLEAAVYWGDAVAEYEELFYERMIKQILSDAFHIPDPFVFEQILDVFDVDHPASPLIYRTIMEMAQVTQIEHEDQTLDCILMSMPTVIWSRYQIPDPQPDSNLIQAVLDGLKRHIVTPGTQIVMMPAPLSSLNLPASFKNMGQWKQALAQRLQDPQAPLPTPKELYEGVTPGISNAQHWVFAAANKTDKPILRWMGNHRGKKQKYLAAWQAYMEAIYKQLYPNCQFDIFLPDFYYDASTQTRLPEQVRTIHATVDRISTIFNVAAEHICATIIRAIDENFEEYRIGYNLQGQTEVIDGNLWLISPVGSDELELPDSEIDDHDDLYETDLFTLHEKSEDQQKQENNLIDEFSGGQAFNPELATIFNALHECGIHQIEMIDELAPAAYCPDCDIPLFPGPSGSLQHLVAPDDLSETPPYLH